MTSSRPFRIAQAVVLAVLSMAVAGCDKRAREFAEKTRLILLQRSEQLSKKIAAETKAYNASAAHAAAAHRALVDSRLANERNGRSIALAADYGDGRRPASRWQSHLEEYGQIDYTANRELLTADIDAGSRFLQNINAMAIEQDRVDALAMLLAALAKKPTLAQDLVALKTFAEETKTEFDQRVCAQLKADMTGDHPAERKAAAQKAFEAKKCKDE